MKLDLNNLAVKVTKLEGKKVSLPIGQVKEVIKLVLHELKDMPLSTLITLFKRIK